MFSRCGSILSKPGASTKPGAIQMSADPFIGMGCSCLLGSWMVPRVDGVSAFGLPQGCGWGRRVVVSGKRASQL